MSGEAEEGRVRMDASAETEVQLDKALRMGR